MTSVPPLSLRKKLCFGAVLSVTMTVLLLGACELALRLAGVGHDPGFLRVERAADGTRWWRENRWCTAPWFSPELVRRPQPLRLPFVKAPGTVRIFVLGSSAAMGDPEPSFSVARMLEVMLREAYPELRFEVVNAAITAINSHVVRAIAADCAEAAPDFFIVYEGNNEVIGPFGPGTVFTPFLRSPAALRVAAGLRATRTGQLLAALGRRARGAADARVEWTGMEMFLPHQIAADDPRLVAMRRHFRANLVAVVAAARDAGAHTLLCTVPVNQKDFAPFLARVETESKATPAAGWREAFDAGDAALAADDSAEAVAAYRRALALDERDAELHFRLGRALLQRGTTGEAAVALQGAVDQDALRFRADSALNAIIRDFASSPEGIAPDDLVVVDLAQRLAAASAGGVIGDEFLYEHVHLNLRGTYEVARELFAVLGAQLVARGQLAPGAVRAPIAIDAARLRLGYTTYEQAMIVQELLARFGRAPFTQQSDRAQRVGTYRRIAEQAQRLLDRPGSREALMALYQQAITLAPDDWMLARNAGMMLVALGDPEQALPLLTRATTVIPDDADTWFALATAQRALGRRDEAAAAFATVRVLEPRYPGAAEAPAESTTPPPAGRD